MTTRLQQTQRRSNRHPRIALTIKVGTCRSVLCLSVAFIDTNQKRSHQFTVQVLKGKEIDVILVGESGVGKSSLINMVIGVPDGSRGAARVSNDVKPCTMHTTSYSTSLEAGLRCRLWDTRGIIEVAGTNDRGLGTRIRQLASQQARELKPTFRGLTGIKMY